MGPASGDAAAAAQRAVSESVVPDAVDEVPDSVDDDVPDVVEDVPDAVEDDVLDAVEEVPDVDEVVHCPRCRTFHAGGVFGEACRQARRNARSVPVVAFYMKITTLLHKFSMAWKILIVSSTFLLWRNFNWRLTPSFSLNMLFRSWTR